MKSFILLWVILNICEGFPVLYNGVNVEKEMSQKVPIGNYTYDRSVLKRSQAFWKCLNDYRSHGELMIANWWK